VKQTDRQTGAPTHKIEETGKQLGDPLQVRPLGKTNKTKKQEKEEKESESV
jgi:hypothetical protein